jgi:hypothetical protein
MTNKKIIAIDFDGTIVEDQFPEIGKLMPGAKEAINELYHSGDVTIIIWTCRNGINMLRAVEFLAREGIKYHYINQSCPDNVRKYGSDTRKVYADIYIDDKGLGKLPEWSEIREHLQERLNI